MVFKIGVFKVLEKLDIQLQKNETGLLPYTIFKN